MSTSATMTGSFLALVVSEVNERHIRNDGHGRLELSALPLERIQLPVVDIWSVAVLSWRWDIDRPFWWCRNPDATGPSPNIVAAVRHAKATGVKYLFIDAISIDQQQDGTALINEVLAFAELYETLPVIAAYDTIFTQSFDMSMMRPWIVYEMRRYRNNPYRVTYIGHHRRGGCEGWNEHIRFNMNFEVRAGRIWHKSWNGYTNSILAVLTGYVGMTDLRDLRFILPAYDRIIDRAYATMCRNDFLLTMAVLCQALAVTDNENTMFEIMLSWSGWEDPPPTIKPGDFRRYQVKRIGSQPRKLMTPKNAQRGQMIATKQAFSAILFAEQSPLVQPEGGAYTESYHLILDNQAIAEWTIHVNDTDLYHNSSVLPYQLIWEHCSLTIFDNAERCILTTLGLHDEWDDFANTEPQRKECMYMGTNEGNSRPAQCDVEFVDLSDLPKPPPFQDDAVST